MPITLDELEKENKELLNEIRSAAAKAERDRLTAIDGMSMAGYEDLIDAAKKDPAATAESVAVQIVARQKKQGENFLNGRAADAKDGNLGEIGAAKPEDGKNSEEELKSVLDEVFKEV